MQNEKQRDKLFLKHYLWPSTFLCWSGNWTSMTCFLFGRVKREADRSHSGRKVICVCFVILYLFLAFILWFIYLPWLFTGLKVSSRWIFMMMMYAFGNFGIIALPLLRLQQLSILQLLALLPHQQKGDIFLSYVV